MAFIVFIMVLSSDFIFRIQGLSFLFSSALMDFNRLQSMKINLENIVKNLQPSWQTRKLRLALGNQVH